MITKGLQFDVGRPAALRMQLSASQAGTIVIASTCRHRDRTWMSLEAKTYSYVCWPHRARLAGNARRRRRQPRQPDTSKRSADLSTSPSSSSSLHKSNRNNINYMHQLNYSDTFRRNNNSVTPSRLVIISCLHLVLSLWLNLFGLRISWSIRQELGGWILLLSISTSSGIERSRPDVRPSVGPFTFDTFIYTFTPNARGMLRRRSGLKTNRGSVGIVPGRSHKPSSPCWLFQP